MDETGQTIGQGLWDEVVVPYESQDTLCVMGSGTYLRVYSLLFARFNKNFLSNF